MDDGSCQFTTGVSLLRRQTTGDAALDRFLQLVQSPFKQTFTTNAFLASLGTSVGISLSIFVIWCALRPYNTLVYAPKLRHADSKHAPPPIGKGLFSWFPPLLKCHEADLVDKIGMDATIFLRFMRLCRTMFFFLGIIGCLVMIPVNVTCNLKNEVYNNTKWGNNSKWYVLMSPTYTWGSCMWAHVVVAWVFDFVIMYFLWRNYQAVIDLRRNYFESREYLDSLHSRTLMVLDLPTTYRNDAGLRSIIGDVKVPLQGDEKFAIGRNVKELPALMEKHDCAVRKMEKILAKYLKDPDRLPLARPMCKPAKDDKTMNRSQNVDAIEYWKRRIEELEEQIVAGRKGIDKRDALSYGFVSYPTVSRAHITAKAARGKHPKGTMIRLAMKPQDIIWRNITRSKASRRWNGFIGNVLFTFLSLLYVIPNALIAVFLSNLSNIGTVFPNFTRVLARDPQLWAVVQGFLAPTVTSVFYLVLPILMRRMSVWQGDITKSSRERHVTHKLYVFFIFNNLIVFTIFGTLWTTVQDFIKVAQKNGVNWDTVRGLQLGDRIAVAIFDVSTFWITYLLQRNLGAILDLVQIVSLFGRVFSTRFLSPTPRQRIEWTAPPPFDYATYYNYFLFYTTIALCFSTVQPLVLPVVFFYFLIDSFLKKYTLMYVFVTKVESGGTFWRLLFNRLLLATGFFNLVVGLIVWSRFTGQAAATVLPLLLILIGFKIYCHKTFDIHTRYHTRGADRDSMIASGNFRRRDGLDMKYNHPALHSKLMKPMVPGKVEHLMAEVYHEKATAVPGGPGGIGMNAMQHENPGRRVASTGFEVVREEDMDFANFKNRAEFGDEHGAGVIYNDENSLRTMTPPPGFASPSHSRAGTPTGRIPPSPLALGSGGTEYVPAPSYSPGMSPKNFRRPLSPVDIDGRSDTESTRHLLRDPDGVGFAAPTPYGQDSQSQYDPYEQFRGARR